MNQFARRGQDLIVGGTTLEELAARAGRTPFFVYDTQLIEQRASALRAALPPTLHLHFAIKANPHPQVVNTLAQSTDGLDVASAAELRIALATGTPAASISFAGPGKSREDLELAVASGVIINVESETELARISSLGRATGVRPKIALRVNPDFELKSAGMKMGSGAKPFGIDAERVPVVLHSLPDAHVDFVGLHIFCGSQNLNADAICEAQVKTVDLAIALAGQTPLPLRWLNIGGGLGVPYFPGEQHLPLAPIARNLTHLVERCATELPRAQVVMELGRYLTAEAGLYVCEVIDRKESRGETFLVTNGGLHHHLAASGNFGQVIRKNYPLAVGNRMAEPATEIVNVVGPLCTPLDILGSRVALPHAEPGDLIVVYQSGAYACSASPHQFLSHPSPVELVV
ncbi:MAG: pyridoxal-dependent decarboxylase, exosortase A system-associated [Gammaproteobacteria bacterium]|nr:pyridoxal-dependent decarboxylase, exosortase A system-associated [Gammaproteobacteria bacterium]